MERRNITMRKAFHYKEKTDDKYGDIDLCNSMQMV